MWLSVLIKDTSVTTGTRTHTLLIRNTRARVRCSLPLGHYTPQAQVLSSEVSSEISYLCEHTLIGLNKTTELSPASNGMTVSDTLVLFRLR